MQNSKLKKTSSKFTSQMLIFTLVASFAYTIPVEQAEAQRRTLLEQWIDQIAEKNRERRLKRQKRFKRPQPQVKAVERKPKKPAPAIKKVSGPKYYNYKTEGLVRFSLAGILPQPEVKPVTPVNSPVDVYKNVPPAITGLDTFKANKIDLSQTGTIEKKLPRIEENAVANWSMKVEPGIANALKKHYSKSPEYIWVGADMRPNAHAADIVAALNRAGNYGLDIEEYLIEFPPVSPDRHQSEIAAAQFELSLSAAIMRYAQDAANGRINPNRISGYHDFPKYKRHYGDSFKKIVASQNPATVMESMHPSNQVFAGLVAELAELEENLEKQDIKPIKAGTLIKPGQAHEELPKVIELIKRKGSDEIRTKHAQTFASYDQRIILDEALSALVKDFQREKGLGADGIIGRRTIAKLQSVSPAVKIEKIKLAMERLRWHPNELGQRHVMINQPAYRVNYMVNGRSKLAMNVVVGKNSNQTSFFHDTIEIVEVNPYWNVPRSILVNEMLDKIRSNPGYLAARNYEVVTYGGKPRDPYSVDWYSEKGIKSIYIRQKPGTKNALGELKILFPNKHAIYMHDTPAKKLFSRSKRAYSHGCVRLADPRAMAAAVLGTTKEQIGSYIDGGKNRSLPVANKLPVYVAYFTAWADENGKVDYFNDVYGRDNALKKALKKIRQLRDESGIKLAS